ncbi:fad binding domain protein [Rutstroemia sp. NJR-2017a BBW]|nr:fad binding domain protein [Rutstroemia sp. NJR-2017a BBW]
MTDTHDNASAPPLRILIVGAGIGGLTAAIALRKQGHEVEVANLNRRAAVRVFKPLEGGRGRHPCTT